MAIPRQNIALLIIDMQNGFCKPGGSMTRIGFDISMLASAIEPCVRLVDYARTVGIPIIYTRYVYREDFADGGILVHALMPQLKQERALTAGSWDAQVVEELTPRAGDIVIDKNRPSAFHATGLKSVLMKSGIDHLAICGVTTNCCVESTVRDASQHDILPLIIADAVAELEQARHEAALKTMGLLFGRIVTVAEIASAWTSPSDFGLSGFAQSRL
jgi:ureidoacrylate peracid hydrolase